MTIEEARKSTVAQIVTHDIAYAHIFKKYSIDFCCGGGISLEKACQENNLDVQTLTDELFSTQVQRDQNDYNSWPLERLVDHIKGTHHVYVKKVLPILEGYAAVAAKVHGQNFPQLLRINEIVQQLSPELQSHLQKEENILFPHIKKLLIANQEQENPSVPKFAIMQKPIQVMEEEHDHAGAFLKELASLTDNYNPPPDACNTFKALYHLLAEFENDMHIHVHLENNILFPKAIELETNTL